MEGHGMLLSVGHGGRVVLVDAASPPETQLAAAFALEADREAVVGAEGAAAPRARRSAAAALDGDRFGFLFPGSAGLSPIAGAQLDALADVMVEQGAPPATPRTNIPAIMTYLGQFIDHDITANTDRDNGQTFTIVGQTIAPLARDLVVAGISNLRRATLGLDSVYGDGPLSHPLEAVMRDGPRMRLGVETDVMPQLPPAERPPLPADTAADLPRVGPLVAGGLLDPAAVPPELLSPGLPPEQSRKAFIGDGRNDENLAVAQLHLAFLRYHNAVVDALAASGVPAGELFARGRTFVRHSYQWLVVNDYLRQVCDPAVVDAVIAAGAPIYKAFYDARKAQIPAGTLPMPLEFSVAAFRFGHSMIRGAYDFNRNFGAEAKLAPRATLADLFTFTGKAPSPFDPLNTPTLPNNWIVEWARFMGGASEIHNARPIDTRVASTLLALPNEGEDPNIPPDQVALLKSLARRNLRRGWLLNLPSAQTLIASFAGAGVAIAPLSPADLTSGPTGGALQGDLVTQTPLWFYILKEAEVLHAGAHLGPLGSRLVAETLVGLAMNDPTSYWGLKPSGAWRPADTLAPGGIAIETLADLLRVAGVL